MIYDIAQHRLLDRKVYQTKKEKAYLLRHQGMNTFIHHQTLEDNQASEGTMARTHYFNFQPYKAV